MISMHKWMGVRLRHSWHRLCLRCYHGSDWKKSKGAERIVLGGGIDSNGGGPRHGRRRGSVGVLKYSLFAIASALLFTGSFIYISWRRDYQASEQFLLDILADGTNPEQNSGNGTGETDGGGNVGGRRPDVKRKSRETVRYDPKARAFVDPSLQPKWGPEADKGRAKRKLFWEIYEMSKAKKRPMHSLTDLMALPSTFDPFRAMSDTTIILNHWKRTTLQQQLEAILAQTVVPMGGVWVCLFNSPREGDYRRIVEMYRDRFKDFGGLFFVASSFNFKYYGRFQLALQARTKYVWIVDDDVLPGKKFLEQLSHIAGIPEANGWQEGADGDGKIGPMALGSVGWVMPGAQPDGSFYGYRRRTDKGGLLFPDKRYGIPVPFLQEVDLLCSHWFIETGWVPLLFREHWETAATGEDYMLAYSLRKYAGVRSYALPMDLSDSETWGNTDVEWDMQHQGSSGTTVKSMVPMRDRLWHRLFKRGGDYFMSPRYAKNPRPILFVVDSEKDAYILRPLFRQLAALSLSAPPSASPRDEAQGDGRREDDASTAVSLTSGRPPRVVTTGRWGNTASCPTVASAIGLKEGESAAEELCDPDVFQSAWQLNAGRQFPRDEMGRGGSSGGRDHTLMLDLSSGILGAVQTISPLAIVSVGGTGVAAGVGGEGGGGAAMDEALAAVSAQSGVPVVRLERLPASSNALRWLAWLSPEAFRYWHRARIDILVVYDPSPSSSVTGVNDVDGDRDERNVGGSGDSGFRQGHTEAQLASLLDSLEDANYFGDSVSLTVAVGGGARVPKSVGELAWHRGPKFVRESLHAVGSAGREEERRGVAAAVTASVREVKHSGQLSSDALAVLALQSWVPRDSDNFVVVLEASSVVSEYFYSWLKAAVLETRYSSPSVSQADKGDAREGDERVHGVCLQSGAVPGAWLLAPKVWRSAQARCFGGNTGDSAGAGGAEEVEASCTRHALIPSLERSLCPAMQGSLVSRTCADGKPRQESEKLVVDDELVVALARKALFDK